GQAASSLRPAPPSTKNPNATAVPAPSPVGDRLPCGRLITVPQRGAADASKTTTSRPEASLQAAEQEMQAQKRQAPPAPPAVQAGRGTLGCEVPSYPTGFGASGVGGKTWAS